MPSKPGESWRKPGLHSRHRIDIRILQGAPRHRISFHGKHPRDPAAAAHSHIFGQRNLGGHHESQFDRVALADLKIGVEENSTATQILGETTPFAISPWQTHCNRKLEVEALRCAAFKMDWIGAHGFSAKPVLPDNPAIELEYYYPSRTTRGSWKFACRNKVSEKPPRAAGQSGRVLLWLKAQHFSRIYSDNKQ